MTRKWGDTEWTQLSNGKSVNVPKGEQTALVSIAYTDPHELRTEYPLLLRGRVIDHIEVNGRRWIEPPIYVESCEVID